MHQVDIAEATKTLPELIEAAIAGEEIIITRCDQPVVKLSSIIELLPQRIQAGSAKGIIWIADDFDEPLEDFNN